jgi:hypothetical protein
MDIETISKNKEGPKIQVNEENAIESINSLKLKQRIMKVGT